MSVVAEPAGGNQVLIPTVSDVGRAFLSDTRFITGFFGPVGCAKTTIGCTKGYLYAQEWPGSRGLIIRDTYRNLADTTMRTWFEWYPDGKAGSYHKTDKIFTIRTSGQPSEVYFRAFDTPDDVKNALSLEVAWIFIDEPQGGPNLKSGSDPGISKEVFEALVMRAGRQKGYPMKMLWMTGNPPSPSHWIAQFFDYTGTGQPRTDQHQRRLYLGTRADNQRNLVTNYYEDIEGIIGSSTPMARRFLFGEWIDFATEQPFRQEWIRRYPHDDIPTPDLGHMDIVMGVDPAISKKDTAAKTALVVIGQGRQGPAKGLRYVLDARAGHWSVDEQMTHIYQLARLWKVRRIRVETVAYQRALAQILELNRRIAGSQIAIEEVKPDGDKLRRANGWSGFVQSGFMVFSRLPGVDELIESMVRVPGDRSKWDLVDAAGIAMSGLELLTPDLSRILQPTGDTLAASYVGGVAPVSGTTGGRFNFGLGDSPRAFRRARGYTVPPRFRQTPR